MLMIVKTRKNNPERNYNQLQDGKSQERVSQVSFIHPNHAVVLSFFTHERSLTENLQLSAAFFHSELQRAGKLIQPNLL